MLKNFFQNEDYSKTYVAFIIAIAFHITAFSCFFFKQHKEIAQSPLLSFKLTKFEGNSYSKFSAISADSGSKQKNMTLPINKDILKSEPKIKKAQKTKPTSKEEKIIENLQKTVGKNISAQDKNEIILSDRSAIFDAAYLKNAIPPYPTLSKRMKEQGLVIIKVYVEESGDASQISLKLSSGFERLDNAALKAVENWHFIAAKNNDVFVASWVEIPIKFKLE